MGLSNQERYGKILWTVKKLKGLINMLGSGYSYRNLKTYEDKLWPALLNKEGNSGYWVFGGGFDQTSFKGGFLQEIFDEHVLELKDPSPTEDEPSVVSMTDMISRNIQASGVLPHEESLIVQIYEWIENFYYAVNRYQDEFSESFKDLTSLISNIKGELFDIMSCNPIYLRAYLQSNILKKVICPYTDDPVKKFLVDKWLYHDLKLTPELKTEVLWDMWKDLQFKRQSEISLEDRFLTIITCMDRRMGSKSYMRKEIFERLKEFVDSEKLDSTLDKCEESHKMTKQKEEDRAKNSHDWCSLTHSY
jgi:hypothetical protein